MNKIFSIIALIVAVVAALFHLAKLAPEFVPVMIIVSIIFLCVGVLRGE